jgi:uncharacterized membrane-anchored protein
MKKLYVILALIMFVAMQTTVYAEDEVQPKYNWIAGGTTVQLGEIANLDLGKEFGFLDAENTIQLSKDIYNTPTGKEIGSVYPADPNQNWQVIFEYEETGHIKDEEKKLDDAAILKSYVNGTEADNENKEVENQLHVTGWDVNPFYEESNHNLSWSIAAKKPNNDQLVNYNVRLLTRTGYISAILVSDPEHREVDRVTLVNEILPKIQAVAGQRYEDYDPSKDKVSKYGLTALIVGGAGLLVAKKVGLIAVIFLFLKKAGIVIVPLAYGLWRFIKGKLTRKTAQTESYPTEQLPNEETTKDVNS